MLKLWSGGDHNWSISQGLPHTFAQTGEMREVAHFQYVSWPDFGVPRTAAGVLAFLGHVRQHHAAAVAAMGSVWHGHPQGPPIVVHCSAGIGRSGKSTICRLYYQHTTQLMPDTLQKV